MKKNLVLLLSTLVISFAISEILCRISGRYASYNERTDAGGYTSPFHENAEGWFYTYHPYETQYLKRSEFTDSWTANEDGLKDKNITPVKNGKRILVLGDSFTEGVGAPPDSSYPRLLESLLHSSGDSMLEVINAGVGGSDIFFEYKLLQHLLPKYQPDMVIVTLNSSDLTEYLTRGGFERFHNDGTLHYKSAPWFEPLYAHSILARVVIHDVFGYDYSFVKRKDYHREMEKAEAEVCSAADSFQLFCNKQHLGFGLVCHPFYNEVKHPELYLLRNIITCSRNKNIAVADEAQFLNAKRISGANTFNIYWKTDGHFNRLGYELLAACAFEFLKKLNWLPVKDNTAAVAAIRL